MMPQQPQSRRPKPSAPSDSDRCDMTPEFKAAIIRRCCEIYAHATPRQLFVWECLPCGGFLAREAAEWPFDLTPDEHNQIREAASELFD